MADRMPKVDMTKEYQNLNETDKYFVKKMERMNTLRAAHISSSRGTARKMGFFLGATVLGIYFYTIFAVKQEKFLDFEVPAEESKKQMRVS
ncbi:hypothetical protein CHS0354_043166 [Potamilus streckersoni]|uniref:Cytochrome c oxidase assembly factor 3 mitochondrial coiled-coil domain-containing protein n=1 Tax=Potamilus streckersoni TaxID=2493646 RepID=A0AAE0SNU4_9BIVA|nr:hypothetical protein CHS0354_043166 [Potamilus streckersoni]